MLQKLEEDAFEVALAGWRFWLIVCSLCQGIASIDVLLGASQQLFCTKLTKQDDNSAGSCNGGNWYYAKQLEIKCMMPAGDMYMKLLLIWIYMYIYICTYGPPTPYTL